ncbi:MAG: hypothetical protein ACTSUE_20585 [Promethearchaeota archaeon]
MSGESEGRRETTHSFSKVDLEEGPSNTLVYFVVISCIVVFIVELIWLIYELIQRGSEIMYLLITLPIWIFIINTFISTKKILNKARKLYESKASRSEPICANCGKHLSPEEFKIKSGKMVKPVIISRSRVYFCKKCYSSTWLKPSLIILLLFITPWYIFTLLYYLYAFGSIDPIASIFAPVILILVLILIPAVIIFTYVDFRKRYS